MGKSQTSSTAQSGTPWEVWLREQGEMFFLYARQQTRSESDAKDVLQDSLTEVWLKKEGAIPDKAHVFSTIRRRAIDLGRAITRRSTREERYSGCQVSWFTPDYSFSDTQANLETAVQKLPNKLSEIIMLKIWGDLTFPQISELTGVSVATLTSRYRYAIDRLREDKQLTELKK